MCGISGFWKNSADSPEIMRKACAAMNATLHHRGPDDGGVD